MYVEPLYIQAESIAFPELKQVIVADAKRVVMKGDLKSALDALVKKREDDTDGPDTTSSTVGPPTPQNIEDVRRAFEDLRQTLDQLEQAMEDLLESTEEGGQ